MTTIVGYAENGVVCMGGDHLGTNGSAHAADYVNSKVFQSGEMLFGFTDSYRLGQILEYQFFPPKQQGSDDLAYLCTAFIGSLIETLIANKYATVENNIAEGGNFLLGYRGKLYLVEGNFQILESANPYNVCGPGYQYALGALHAIEHANYTPMQRVALALEAAAAFDPGTGLKRTILTIGEKQ